MPSIDAPSRLWVSESCVAQERAESMERVLAVDLLHLMAAEGSYGAQIAQQLDASEVWHAYRDQKHDLFLPAGATSQVRPRSTSFFAPR